MLKYKVVLMIKALAKCDKSIALICKLQPVLSFACLHLDYGDIIYDQAHNYPFKIT